MCVCVCVQLQVVLNQRLNKWYLIPLFLTLSIIRYGAMVSGEINKKEQHLPLHLSVVAIEKGAFELPLITFGQLICIYIYI